MTAHGAMRAARGSGGDEAIGAIARLELDDVLERARGGAVDEALDRLIASLAEVRAQASAETWSRVLAAARAHPLRGFLHLEPFTFRCYSRPGGHAGDARALDYVLRGRELPMPMSDPTAALHQRIIRGQTARMLRFRCGRIARAIEEAVEQCPRPPRILGAGCGDRRERDRIVAFGSRRIGRIVAFDTDREALEQVRHDHAGLPIDTQFGSLRDLIRGGAPFTDMDLVYCSGLMEALPASAAAGLARALFGAVRHGGSLMITQVLAGLREAAFLEAFMDWQMVYRTRAEAVALVQDLLAHSVQEWNYGESPESTLGVITLRRR